MERHRRAPAHHHGRGHIFRRSFALLLCCASFALTNCAASSSPRTDTSTTATAAPAPNARIAANATEHEIRMEPQNPPTTPAPNAPNPKQTPEDVIGTILRALQHNDEPTPDAGIAITFAFASPGNREVTGPLARFVELVKNPLYRPLLNHRRAERGLLKTVGSTAQQKVTLYDKDGRRALFLFTLSKQLDGPYKDCWMTDGVERLPPAAEDDERNVASSNGHFPHTMKT